MEREEIVKNTVEYIDVQLKNETSALSLDEVAEKIGYSKFYLNRVFREYMNMTIHQYIQGHRLTEAAEKLLHSDKAIIDIAYEAGYQSHQAFTNAFHAIYLCAPIKYRSTGRQTGVRMEAAA